MSARADALGSRPLLGRAPASVAGAAAGLALLLGRVAGPPALRSPWTLAGLYVALATASLLPAGGDEAGGRAPVSTPVVVAAGAGAVVLARLVGGPRVGPSVPSGSWLAVAATLGVLAALAEEAFFRRFLYDRLERFGAFVAVAISALCFAAVHVPAYGTGAFPVDLGAGLVLGWQRWAGGTWLAPASTHALANLVAVLP